MADGRVTGVAAVVEPTASAGAARELAGIVGDAIGTRGGGSRSSGCCFESTHVGTGVR